MFLLKLFSPQSIKTQKHLGVSSSFSRENLAVQEDYLVRSPAVREGTGCFQFSAKFLCEGKKFLSSLSRVPVGYDKPRVYCFSSSWIPWVQGKDCGIPHSGMILYMQNKHTCFEYIDPLLILFGKLVNLRVATITINWRKKKSASVSFIDVEITLYLLQWDVFSPVTDTPVSNCVLILGVLSCF